jgi:hypothetical protein
MNDLTEQEQIAKAYAACMDSVNLINSEKPENTTDEEWTATLERNREHLRIQLAKDMFAGYDLTPLQQAVGE